jgi:hypothetical protein
MTIPALESVALCAWLTPAGDRAFRYAFALARRRGLRLEVFSFVESPFELRSPGLAPGVLPAAARRDVVLAADRDVRFYYEPRLGDFVDVGFRVCDGPEELELRRCLSRRQYQVLVLPYAERGGPFGRSSIEEFALRFPAPVVLVSAPRPHGAAPGARASLRPRGAAPGAGGVRFWLNEPAALIAHELRIGAGAWRRVEPASARCRTA